MIFSLGSKGFAVVKALSESSCAQSIHCVIGQDVGVTDDYSSILKDYCDQRTIRYSYRNNVSYNKDDYDLFVAVGWRWIIRDIPQDKLIIFHDSLLPKYRGFAPLVSALINKENVTGVTALLGAEKYDTGNIILQRRLNVVYPTNIEREIQRISIVYAELAVDLFSKIDNKSINLAGYQQDEKEATYSLWRDDNDYRINWNDDANNIEHFINCVSYPYKGASAVLNGSMVRITKASALADIVIENRSPGKVIFMESDFPVVVCGRGILMLQEIRNEQGDSVLPLKYFRSRFY